MATTTLQDIADRAGVSRMTVSLVLNSRQYHRVSSETRQRIESIAQELGYRPNPAARLLKGKRSGILGLLIPRTAKPVDLDRLVTIEARAADAGYRLMVGHISPEGSMVDAYINDFEDYRTEGVIWIGHQQFLATRVKQISKRLQPVVLIAEPVPADACHVRIDQANGSAQAVNHLLVIGRRRIAMALGFPKWIGTHQRVQGYREAFAAAGLDVDERLIFIADKEDRQMESWMADELADAIVADTVVRYRADALIAQNDAWAAALVKAMRRHGLRIPDDVAVIGQDNSPLAMNFDPPLTSLDRQPDAVAQAALRLLLRSIHGGQSPLAERVAVVEPKLVIRESTAANASPPATDT